MTGWRRTALSARKALGVFLMKIAAIDLETTGDDAKKDVACEVGVVFIDQGRQYHTLIHPGKRDIHPLASACHHLTKDTFKTSPSIKIKKKFWKALLGDQDYLVAHNAAFDSQFVPYKKIPWICTYRCALFLYQNAPKHSLQALRYWLELKPDVPSGLHPHRALYDAICLASLFQDMLKMKTADELYAISSQPLLLGRVKFGKHRDTPYSEVPKDYLQWILKQDFDEDVKFTARHYLNGRQPKEDLPGAPTPDTLAVDRDRNDGERHPR